MQYYDVLKKAAKDAGVPLTKIGFELGKGYTYVSGAVSRGSLPKVDNAAKMLHVCGWALVAVPQDAIPETALVVDGGTVEETAAARAEKAEAAAAKAEAAAAAAREAAAAARAEAEAEAARAVE